MKHFGTANEFVNLWFGLNREILNADMIKINCLNPEKFARAIEEFVREVQVPLCGNGYDPGFGLAPACKRWSMHIVRATLYTLTGKGSPP